MIRKLLLHGLPFLLPFVVYAFYVLMARRAERRGVQWRHAPWYWLTATGLGLSILSLVLAALLAPGSGEGPYQPARVIDGQIVSGEADN
jgi:hypothetical protein